MTLDFLTAKMNLAGFIQSLPQSNVKFLFFLARNLAQPMVCDSLRSVDVRGNRFYLAPGITDEYCYAYSKGFIQYVVTPVVTVAPPSPPSGSRPRAFNVTINSSGPAPLPSVLPPRILAEHGRHLDFGILRNRMSGIVIKSHVTNYTELFDGTGFTRSMNECNFRFSNASLLLGTRDEFGGCLCETAPVRTTLADVYDDAHSDMLRLLCSKVAGIGFSGGGWKRARGKQNNRPNMHRGGAIPSPFLTPGFVDFVSRRLLQRIATIRPDLETVRVLYDDADEMAVGSSANIVVWYDFEHNLSSMFQIDAVTAFEAYAATAPPSNTNTMTAEDRVRSIERFAVLERALLQAVAVA